MDLVQLKPIGIIRTPFDRIEGMPIQPSGSLDTSGQVVVDPAYEQGLDDLDGFSHLILIYLFHQSKGYELRLKPFLDDQLRGLFSTRAPRRPNPIGLSVVQLTARDANVLQVRGIDVVDQTPLLDIKPYVPAFDAPSAPIRTGWLQNKAGKEKQVRADGRFKKI
jgi:tRNA-Thr(GGU) m(6)t(6)A37 methyltransferase TsaA